MKRDLSETREGVSSVKNFPRIFSIMSKSAPLQSGSSRARETEILNEERLHNAHDGGVADRAPRTLNNPTKDVTESVPYAIELR